jgi:hypothetical protein
MRGPRSYALSILAAMAVQALPFRILGQPAAGPGSPAPPFKSNSAPGPGEVSFQVKHLLSSFEFWLALFILLFGAIIVFIEYLVIRRMQDAKPDDALRLFGITFIIVGTLVFVAAGFDSTQIAPAAGLFGTIAGYLLGKASAPSRPSEPSDTPPQER